MPLPVFGIVPTAADDLVVNKRRVIFTLLVCLLCFLHVVSNDDSDVATDVSLVVAVLSGVSLLSLRKNII